MSCGLFVKVLLSVLSFNDLTWIAIGVPLLSLTVVIVLAWNRRPGSDRAWAWAGKQWFAAGLGLLVAAAVSYIGVALVWQYAPKYDRDFRLRLKAGTSQLAAPAVRAAIVRRLCGQFDEDEMRDRARMYAQGIPPEYRISYTQLLLGSDVRHDTIDWTPLLRGAPSPDGNALMSQSTNLPFDAAQSELYRTEQWDKLYPSLRPEQWKFLSDQFLRAQDRQTIPDILANVSQSNAPNGLPASETSRLIGILSTGNPGGEARITPRTLALEANEPRAEPGFRRVLDHIVWWRELPWLGLIALLGCFLLYRGRRMQAQPPLFQCELNDRSRQA